MTECFPHPAPPRFGEGWPDPSHALGSLIVLSPLGKVVCEEPNSQMHHFIGCLTWEGEKYSLDSGNILLRGCKIRNTDTCYGLVIYAGTAALGPLQHELSWWGWVGTLKLLARTHKARLGCCVSAAVRCGAPGMVSLGPGFSNCGNVHMEPALLLLGWEKWGACM